MPPVAMALRMPWIPNGAKPPAALKLEALKDRIIKAIMARKGMASFHTVIALLDLARLATPRMFMTVNRAISTTATTMPGPVRTVTPAVVEVSHGK
jgi:hypothetical protein